MSKIIIYFPKSGTLSVYSKWIVCFFGDLYCTELDLQGKFRVSNTNLVSIDIEEFWYRTSMNISIDIDRYIALLLLHTVLLLGTVFYVNIRHTT